MKSHTLVLVLAVSLGLSNIALAQGHGQGQSHSHRQQNDEWRRDQTPASQRYDQRADRRFDQRSERWNDRRDQYNARSPEFTRGGHIPREYRNANYVVRDYRTHRLPPPPHNHRWVQVGSDYVLIAIATGIIASIVLNH